MHSNLKPLCWTRLYFSIWQVCGFWDLNHATAAITRSLRTIVCYAHQKGKWLQAKFSTENPSSEHDIHMIVWIWVSVFKWQGTSESSRSNCWSQSFLGLCIHKMYLPCQHEYGWLLANWCQKKKTHNLELRQTTWFRALSKGPNCPLACEALRLEVTTLSC